jgi:hypothetical protein
MMIDRARRWHSGHLGTKHRFGFISWFYRRLSASSAAIGDPALTPRSGNYTIFPSTI